MSYAFDTMAHVFGERIRPHVPDSMLAELFSELIEAMHSANHRVPSADGVFNGDGVNKAPEVADAARRLDEHVGRRGGGRGDPGARQVYLVNFIHECAGGESYVDFAEMTGEEAAEIEAFLQHAQPDVSDISMLPIPPPGLRHSFAKALEALRSHFAPEDDADEEGHTA